MSPTGPSYGTAFTANPALKTTLVKAVFDGTRFITPDGQALPQIKAGAPVTLRINLSDFVDTEQAGHYASGYQVELLPFNTRLMAIVKDNPDRPSDFASFIADKPRPPEHFDDQRRADIDYARWCMREMEKRGHWGEAPNNPLGAVEVFLLEPLKLTIRSDKTPRLGMCLCETPYLSRNLDEAPEPATSLNHAFTRISERFEPHRISHTGNAFLCYYYQDRGKFRRLDSLVDEVQKKQTKM